MHHVTLIWAMVAIGLTACSRAPVYRVPVPLADPLPTASAPVLLQRLEIDLERGDVLAHVGHLGCYGLREWQTVGDTSLDFEDPLAIEGRDRWNAALEAAGFDVVFGRDLMFDEEQTADIQRVEYRVIGRVTKATFNLCRHVSTLETFIDPFSTPFDGYIGEASITVTWGVFSNLEGKVVYRVATEGFANLLTRPSNDAPIRLMLDAVQSASAHLAGDDGFRNAVTDFETVQPAFPKLVRPPGGGPPVLQGGADDPIMLSAPLPRTGLFDAVAARATTASFTVRAGSGHGSGVLISADGLILTNYHVVGEARRVRVATPEDKAFVATVIRRDARRDVALLRITLPDDNPPIPLPITVTQPEIGARVYAIGTPESRRLPGTVLSGVLGRDWIHPWTKKRFLRADIPVRPGTSGGPMLDQHGNLIGLTVAQVINRDDRPIPGGALFVPIAEALDVLHLVPAQAGPSVISQAPP